MYTAVHIQLVFSTARLQVASVLSDVSVYCGDNDVTTVSLRDFTHTSPTTLHWFAFLVTYIVTVFFSFKVDIINIRGLCIMSLHFVQIHVERKFTYINNLD